MRRPHMDATGGTQSPAYYVLVNHDGNTAQRHASAEEGQPFVKLRYVLA